MTLESIAQTSAYLVAAIGGPIAAIWSFKLRRETLNQQKREHRWRQADLGRQLIDELYLRDRDADVALQFIDDELSTIAVDGIHYPISMVDVRQALTYDQGLDSKSIQIRRSFDALFYHLEKFANMIRVELITVEDVQNPTMYYCAKLKVLNPVIEAYLRPVGYVNAWMLIVSLQELDFLHQAS